MKLVVGERATKAVDKRFAGSIGMLNWKSLTAMALSVGVSTVVVVQAQQRGAGTAATRVTTLTAMDHVQIRQLVARYAWTLDSGTDNGYAYADLFTPDGESVRPDARGREQLAALARGGPRGPAYRHHYAMNHVIEVSADGVTGRQYVIGIDFDDSVQVPTGRGQDGQPVSQWERVGVKGGQLSTAGGHYEDVYVKIVGGWRFKRREFIPSESGPQTIPSQRARLPVAPASGATPATAARQTTGTSSLVTTLTALDYLEIERLVASYGHALDSGFGHDDNAPAYARLFAAPDGTFFSRGRPYKGPEELAAIARAQPHGPGYVRHYLTNHVIEPTADGATGKEYLVVIDIGEGGKPGSIYLGGYYHDIYVKTPEGWRFKTRSSFGSSAGPQPAQSGPSR